MAINAKNYNPEIMANGLPGFLSGTSTVAGGSATINFPCGIATTGALTTGTAAATTFFLVNDHISTTSQVLATIIGGTNTGGLPAIGQCTIGVAGSATISIVNADSTPAGSAFNGTLKVAFIVLN